MAKLKYNIGDLIESRYRVVAAIGQGGMSELYRVADVGRGYEDAALKLVRMETMISRKDRLGRIFQNEFRLMTQLWHPNLVEVYNYGVTQGGNFYFTMEYVDGPDLEGAMGTMGLEKLIPTLVQICRALMYLESRGMVHGDLKPSNVMLDGEQIRLVDFGLAREVKGQQTRQRYMSPHYAAPELGSGSRIDSRADLYSLGAIAYKWLAGEPPAFMVASDRMIAIALREALMQQKAVPPKISEIFERLLAHDPNDRYANANEVIEALNVVSDNNYALETKATLSSYALRTRFVGREAEQEKLLELWEQSKGNHGQIVLIGGESGVGKTRLVEEIEVEIELAGWRVVWGQCLEKGGGAYQPWREVLRVLLRTLESEQDVDLSRVGPVLAAILPEMWDRPYMDGLEIPVELEPLAAQQRLNAAIMQVLKMGSRVRPMVVVFEDAHWADETTQAMVHVLSKMIDFAGLMVCITYRSDEAGEDQFPAQLSGATVQRIMLRNLTPELSTELVESMLGMTHLPAEMIVQLQATTSGNTFFVQELVRSLAEEGQVLKRTPDGWQVDEQALVEVSLPDAIRQVIWRRLMILSEIARKVLCKAAVVGEQFWDGVLQAVSEISSVELWMVIEEALEKELIFEREYSSITGQREFMFAKPIIQQVGYESLEHGARSVMHSGIAAWLIARRPEDIESHLGLIAEHLDRSDRIHEAVVYYKRAGERAASEYANAEAVRLLSRALNLLPDDHLIEQFEIITLRVSLFHMLGAREAQGQDLATLEKLAESLDGTDPSKWVLRKSSYRAKVAILYSDYAEKTGDFQTATAKADRAIDLSQSAGDIFSEASGRHKLGRAFWRQGYYNDARNQIEHARSLAHAANSEKLAFHCLFDLSVITSFQGNPLLSLDLYSQAIIGFRKLGDLQMEARILCNQSVPYNDLGNFVAARDSLERGLMISQKIGYHMGESDSLGNLCYSLTNLREFEQAIDYGFQALNTCREINNRLHESLSLYNLGRIYYLLGDYSKARDFAKQSLPIAVDVDSLRVQALAMDLFSEISLELGNNLAALEDGQKALQLIKETGRSRHEPYFWISVARALFELNELNDAADAYRNALKLWRNSNQNHLVPEAISGQAQILLSQGNLDGAKECVDEILNYIENHNLYGTDEPFRIHLTCYLVLQACQDPRTQAVLESAHRQLQEQAIKISDDELRRSYLDKVAVNREIVVEYHRLTNEK